MGAGIFGCIGVASSGCQLASLLGPRIVVEVAVADAVIGRQKSYGIWAIEHGHSKAFGLARDQGHMKRECRAG